MGLHTPSSSFCMMGLHTPSSSFCFSSYSSFSALWLLSSQLMISSHLPSMVALSSASISSLRVFHVVGVVLKAVLGLNAVLVGLVLGLVLLSLLDHLLDLLLGEAALVVGDGDLVLLAGGLLDGRHIEDAVGVDVIGHLDLRETTGHRRDAVKVELAEEMQS